MSIIHYGATHVRNIHHKKSAENNTSVYLQLWRIGISMIQIDCLHELEDHKILNVSMLWAMTHILGLSREWHDSSHVLWYIRYIRWKGSGPADTMYLLNEWEVWTGKYLARDPEVWTKHNELCESWTRAKHFQVRPSHSFNNHFIMWLLTKVWKIRKLCST